jgi:hypothetical protein
LVVDPGGVYQNNTGVCSSEAGRVAVLDENGIPVRKAGARELV